MPSLKVGTALVTDVKIGNTDVQKVYVGSNVVWTRRTHEVISYWRSGSAVGYDIDESGFVYGSYYPSSTNGSISPTTFTGSGGSTATIQGLYYRFISGATTPTVYFRVSGSYSATTDWTSVKIGNTTYTRASAITTWISNQSTHIFEFRNKANPFGAGNGTSHDVIIS
jgi:hypothetical protein